jgi:hypothetical protein
LKERHQANYPSFPGYRFPSRRRSTAAASRRWTQGRCWWQEAESPSPRQKPVLHRPTRLCPREVSQASLDRAAFAAAVPWVADAAPHPSAEQAPGAKVFYLVLSVHAAGGGSQRQLMCVRSLVCSLHDGRLVPPLLARESSASSQSRTERSEANGGASSSHPPTLPPPKRIPVLAPPALAPESSYFCFVLTPRREELPTAFPEFNSACLSLTTRRYGANIRLLAKFLIQSVFPFFLGDYRSDAYDGI